MKENLEEVCSVENASVNKLYFGVFLSFFLVNAMNTPMVKRRKESKDIERRSERKAFSVNPWIPINMDSCHGSLPLCAFFPRRLFGNVSEEFYGGFLICVSISYELCPKVI